MKWAYLIASVLMCQLTYGKIENPKVVHGKVEITQQNTHTQIQSQSSHAIVNYTQFDVSNSESVEFILPKETSKILNRIYSQLPTKLEGMVTCNGILYFVNPNGIIFGPNSTIKANHFFAACAHLADGDFLDNRNYFTNIKGQLNQNGRLEANQIHLIAKDILLNGNVITQNGFLSLISSQEVLISEGDSSIFIKLTPSDFTEQNTIVVSGQVEAKEARFEAGDLIGSLIHLKEQADLKVKALKINAIGFDETKGVIRIEPNLLLESIHIKADKTFIQGKHVLTGNTTVFSSDVELMMDTIIVDPGDIIYEKNVFSEPNQFYSLTLNAGGNIEVMGSVGIDSTTSLGGFNIFSCQLLNLHSSVYAHQVFQNFGYLDTTIQGPIVTATPLAQGGNVYINTFGNITIHDTINTQAALDSINGSPGGDVILMSQQSIIVHDIITNGGPDFDPPIFLGGKGGDVTLIENLEMVITDKLTFSPQGRIGLFGSITALGGPGGPNQALAQGGNVTISGQRSEFPDIATVYSNPEGSDLIIQAENITFFNNSCITVFGNLEFTANNVLSASDHIAVNNITLSANTLNILKHPIGGICLENNTRIDSQSVHASAGGSIEIIVGLQNINFIGLGPDLVLNSLNLDLLGKSRLTDYLLMGQIPLNFNPLGFTSVILTMPMYQIAPYNLMPTFGKMNDFSITNAPSIDAIASEIDSIIFNVDPTLMHSWNQIRQEVLQKNPMDGVIYIYLDRIRTGVFSPSSFVSRLRFSKIGREAIAYMAQVIDLKEALDKNANPNAKRAIPLITEFTLPKPLTKSQWKDVNILMEYHKSNTPSLE